MKTANVVSPLAPIPHPKRSHYQISYEDLEKHFDQPLVEVARKFDVCTTFFKKVCRQHGIKRWPFRKLKSLQRKMQASGHLPQQTDNAQQTARPSPDLQWMLTARSKIGLYAPGGELQGDSNNNQQQADHLAAAQMPSPKAQRGPNNVRVNAGRIVGCTPNSDTSRITPKNEAQELTLDALSQASSAKGDLGQDTDQVEEELIGVLCSMIQQR